MTVIVAVIVGFFTGRMLWLAMRKSWNRPPLIAHELSGRDPADRGRHRVVDQPFAYSKPAVSCWVRWESVRLARFVRSSCRRPSGRVGLYSSWSS